MVARVVIAVLAALVQGAFASDPVSLQARNFVTNNNAQTFGNQLGTPYFQRTPDQLLQSMLSPPDDIIGKMSTFDTMDDTAAHGIQQLTPFGAEPADASENEARMISQIQENLKNMVAKVSSQGKKLQEYGEQIVKLQKLMALNKEILAKNQAIVKDYAAELVKTVTKYTQGLDMGSSSSGAGAAAPAFMEKLGRLKNRAAADQF